MAVDIKVLRSHMSLLKIPHRLEIRTAFMHY